MSAATLLFTLCLLYTNHVHGHGTTGHPIGKLIQGTFAEHDDSGAVTKSLYICKAGGNRYHWAIYQVDAETLDTYLAGIGTFHKSDIDDTHNVISSTNGQCFYQTHGKPRQVTPCTFDVSLLCDHHQISLSFKYNIDAFSLHFTKISTKNELIGNEHVAPYQCAIPWDDDIAAEDVYPYAFASDALWWSTEQWFEANVFDSRDSGCFAYMLPDNSHANVNYGDFFDRQYFWNDALVMQRWQDASLSPDDVCQKGSEFLVRVDKEVMLIGWNCHDSLFGSGYLMYKNSAWNTCPIPRG